MIKSVTAAEVKQWQESDTAVIVDVRELEEYIDGHIAGSIHLPLAEVSVTTLPPFQGKKLIMQCRSGGRSRAACGKVVADIGSHDVYNLEGGILAWAQNGYQLER